MRLRCTHTYTHSGMRWNIRQKSIKKNKRQIKINFNLLSTFIKKSTFPNLSYALNLSVKVPINIIMILSADSFVQLKFHPMMIALNDYSTFLIVIDYFKWVSTRERFAFANESSLINLKVYAKKKLFSCFSNRIVFYLLLRIDVFSSVVYSFFSILLLIFLLYSYLEWSLFWLRIKMCLNPPQTVKLFSENAFISLCSSRIHLNHSTHIGHTWSLNHRLVDQIEHQFVSSFFFTLIRSESHFRPSSITYWSSASLCVWSHPFLTPFHKTRNAILLLDGCNSKCFFHKPDKVWMCKWVSTVE